MRRRWPCAISSPESRETGDGSRGRAFRIERLAACWTMVVCCTPRVASPITRVMSSAQVAPRVSSEICKELSCANQDLGSFFCQGECRSMERMSWWGFFTGLSQTMCTEYAQLALIPACFLHTFTQVSGWHQSKASGFKLILNL
jgi:hypothetical protein